MIIEISELLTGAKKAEGLVVIIDVLRAATTAAYLLSAGAEKIIAVEDIEEALLIKKRHPHYVAVGELSGLKVKGFDYGNSPSEIKKADLKGKTIIFRTSSGVAGIHNAKKAEEILFAGLVNAKATAEYIKKRNPVKTTLVAMGWEGRKKAEEDYICAQTIKNYLRGIEPNAEKIRNEVRKADTAQKFFEKKQDFPEEDFHLAVELNKFNYAIKALKQGPQIILTKAWHTDPMNT